jgi:hypothetical protein
MTKHIMGVVGAILSLWGIGFIYTAGVDPIAVWWDQGTIGLACLIGALVI